MSVRDESSFHRTTTSIVLPDLVWLARLGGESTSPKEGYGGKRNFGSDHRSDRVSPSDN